MCMAYALVRDQGRIVGSVLVIVGIWEMNQLMKVLAFSLYFSK